MVGIGDGGCWYFPAGQGPGISLVPQLKDGWPNEPASQLSRGQISDVKVGATGLARRLRAQDVKNPHEHADCRSAAVATATSGLFAGPMSGSARLSRSPSARCTCCSLDRAQGGDHRQIAGSAEYRVTKHCAQQTDPAAGWPVPETAPRGQVLAGYPPPLLEHAAHRAGGDVRNP